MIYLLISLLCLIGNALVYAFDIPNPNIYYYPLYVINLFSAIGLILHVAKKNVKEHADRVASKQAEAAAKNQDMFAYLNSIFPKIIFWPLDKAAQYANAVCIEMCEEPSLLFPMLQKDSVTDYDDWDTPSVANLAYIILNCKDEKCVELAKKIHAAAAAHFISKGVDPDKANE